MKRLLAIVPAALFALPALAQTVPEASYQDLWCGLAFSTAAEFAPYSEADLAAAQAAGDAATDDQKETLQQAEEIAGYIAGGTALTDKAAAVYLETGYTAESFDAFKTELGAKVGAQIGGGGPQPEFEFNVCLELAMAVTDAMTAPAQ